MIVYKATRADMTCDLGQGIFPYELGKTYTAESSKCGRRGLHACEYILDCMGYYPIDGKNRYFMARAEGSLDEDTVGSRVSCEKLTLLKELDLEEIATEAIRYMICHPFRSWEMSGHGVLAAKDMACGREEKIVIARGPKAKGKGQKGAVLALLLEAEAEPGWFLNVKIVRIDGKQIRANTWYTLNADGKVEVCDEA